MKTSVPPLVLALFLAAPGTLIAQEDAPPPPPPPPAEPAPVLAIPVAEPPGFSAATVNEDTVGEVNAHLKEICFEGPYTVEFKVVLEDDDEDEVKVVARDREGEDEIYEIEFDSEGSVDIDADDGSEEEDYDIDEDEKVSVKLVRKGDELSLYADGDDLIENEEMLDEAGDCHVLSFEVEEEFYFEMLKVKQGLTH